MDRALLRRKMFYAFWAAAAGAVLSAVWFFPMSLLAWGEYIVAMLLFALSLIGFWPFLLGLVAWNMASIEGTGRRLYFMVVFYYVVGVLTAAPWGVISALQWMDVGFRQSPVLVLVAPVLVIIATSVGAFVVLRRQRLQQWLVLH